MHSSAATNLVLQLLQTYNSIAPILPTELLISSVAVAEHPSASHICLLIPKDKVGSVTGKYYSYAPADSLDTGVPNPSSSGSFFITFLGSPRPLLTARSLVSINLNKYLLLETSPRSESICAIIFFGKEMPTPTVSFIINFFAIV